MFSEPAKKNIPSLMYLVFSILLIILLFGSMYSILYYWNFNVGIEVFEKTIHPEEAILFLILYILVPLHLLLLDMEILFRFLIWLKLL